MSMTVKTGAALDRVVPTTRITAMADSDASAAAIRRRFRDLLEPTGEVPAALSLLMSKPPSVGGTRITRDSHGHQPPLRSLRCWGRHEPPFLVALRPIYDRGRSRRGGANFPLIRAEVKVGGA